MTNPEGLRPHISERHQATILTWYEVALVKALNCKFDMELKY